MRFLILSDMFSLESWLIKDEEPDIMPAAYEFFNYLGSSADHSFTAYIFHKTAKRTVNFENGSTIHILPLSVSQYYVRKLVSLFSMYKRGKKTLQKEPFDVVYGMGVYSIVAGRLGKKCGVLSVSRIFGSLVNDVLEKKQYLKLYTRHILQLWEIKYPADIIICTEDGTQFDQALKSLNPSQEVNMLYNGMNASLKKNLLALDPIKKIDSKRQIRLISIGRLTYWKRHDLAIQTIHLLKNKFKLDVQLTILGKGEEYKSLQTLSHKLGLSDEIIFTSPIAHKNIPILLSQQHIGLFLYDVSNMGNAFWESCLSGRLIMTRQNGKINDVIPSGQVTLIDNADPKHIAAAIVQHLDLPIEVDVLTFRNSVDELIRYWDERYELELKIIAENLNNTTT